MFAVAWTAFAGATFLSWREVDVFRLSHADVEIIRGRAELAESNSRPAGKFTAPFALGLAIFLLHASAQAQLWPLLHAFGDELNYISRRIIHVSSWFSLGGL